MTSQQTVNLVRELLDDSRDWYFDDMIRAINEAQLRKIQESFNQGDERGLRPLYRYSGFIANGGTIVPNPAAGVGGVLFPRTCRLYESQSVPDSRATVASYIEPGLYLNMYVQNITPPAAPVTFRTKRWQAGTRFPREAVYTVLSGWDTATGRIEYRLHFNGDQLPPGAFGKLLYIEIPQPVTLPPNPFTLGQAITMPPEYHPEIAALAAEILNDIDVLEYERGEVAFQNQRITLEKSGS